MTVGPGIKPGLLTSFRTETPTERSRARCFARHYRRWGIAPRPENVADGIFGRRAVCNTDFQNVHGAFWMVFIRFSYKQALALPREDLIIKGPGLRTEVRHTFQGASS